MLSLPEDDYNAGYRIYSIMFCRIFRLCSIMHTVSNIIVTSVDVISHAHRDIHRECTHRDISQKHRHTHRHTYKHTSVHT